MELQYVQPGQKVTAQSYNNVVDAIFAGVNSSEGFQNTANGAVVYPRAQLTTSYQSGAWRTMCQVKTAQYWKQTARGQWNPPNMHNTVLIDLGPDAATCKSNISIMGQNVKEAGIVVGDSQSMDCLLEDPVYVNASYKKTSWIDLGIDANSTDFIAADAFKCVEEEGEGDNKKKVTNYYFVVTDKSEDGVIDRAKQLFGISDEKFELVKRFMLAKKGQVGRLDESEVYVQSHTGAILWSMPTSEMLSVDSDISSMLLSSLDTLSTEYQISGLSGEMETKIGNAYSFWNFDKAQRISLGEALAKESSDSQGGQETSCRVDVVLRVGRKDSTMSVPTEVDYLELSSLVVSCDTNFYSKQPKEMKSSSIEWTSAEKGQPALQLKGFKDEESLQNPPDNYSLIIREKNADNQRILKYIDPIDVFKVDSELSSLNRKSLEKKTDPGDASKKFVQLYNFDQPGNLVLSVDKNTKLLPEGYKFVVRHEKSGVVDNDIEVEYADLSIDLQNTSVDSEGTTSKKSISRNSNNEIQIYNFDNATQDLTGTFNSNGMLSDGIDVLVRYNNEIHYASLKVQPGGEISVDTDYSKTSQSIQKQNDGVVKINGWDTKTAKSVTEISSYTDEYDVLLRHHTDGKYQTEFINIAPLLSGGGSAPEKRKISKNWDWPTDLSGNYIAPGAPNATMGGYYIYGHRINYWSGDIPAQPANKNTLILSVEYGSGGYPNNQYFTWTQNIDNSSLSGIGIPLYARFKSPDGGPTYDYNAGLFTIPVYE